jgi:hypothetical protein
MIYLREGGGQHVGPFKSREEAERFIKLMELCGENWDDAEVMEEDGIFLTAGQKQPIQ